MMVQVAQYRLNHDISKELFAAIAMDRLRLSSTTHTMLSLVTVSIGLNECREVSGGSKYCSYRTSTRSSRILLCEDNPIFLKHTCRITERDFQNVLRQGRGGLRCPNGTVVVEA